MTTTMTIISKSICAPCFSVHLVKKNDTNFSFFFKVQSPKDSLVWLQTLWKKVSWRPALWASWRRERCQVFAALAKGKVCQRARRTEENGALERERRPCMSLKGNAPASGVHVLDRRLSKTHTIFLSLTHFYCGENTRECVCTCIYVCLCTWAPLCVYARACVWMCVCEGERANSSTFLCSCVRPCACVWIHRWMFESEDESKEILFLNWT